MNSINEVVGNKKCTNCGACSNICPQKAIFMERNNEGFLVPMIDKKKCNNCGLCNRTCPMLNEIDNNVQFKIPKVYLGWNKNEKVRMKSSSGGIFSVLAEYFLRKKGYICGAAFDNKNHLKHIIISNKKDLKKIMGSKYVQSEIGNVYRKIKILLEKNKWVLFSGTPCQVVGLRFFLKKDYKKLLVVDLVCHGVPSPLVFHKYLKEIEKKRKVKIDKINFRDKSTGWKNFSFSLSKNNINLVREKHDNNIYFKGFLNNLYLNNICTNCPYSKFPKYSDITLGDYWGIWNYKKGLDDDKGISVLIVNNGKGLTFLQNLKKGINFEQVRKDKAVEKLLSINISCQSHQNRDEFFRKVNNKSICKLIDKNLYSNINFNEKNVAILNMRLPTNNYGAILQSFALSKMVTNLGYKPRVINYISKKLDEKVDKYSVLALDKFREGNISYTLPCYSQEDLIKLNKNFNTFIVGSDQVWNYNYLNWVHKDDIGRYFLNFIDPTKNIFSYAASFAEDNWGGDDNEVKIVREALKRFSSISVREKSGINICKNLFNLKSECVLDPTFLLDINEYQKLIDSEFIEKNNKKYIACFTLDKDLEKNIIKNKNLKEFVIKNKLEIKNIRGYIENVFNEDKFIYNSIPSWLNYIKDSEFIITDSYHCVIFAILFEKQFLVIERDYAGNERLKSLLSLLNIKNRFYPSLDKLNYNFILKNKI
ncbi:MAG: polysaccharide pyruvyl transferase family protein, partial [Candidatus Muiribacteriota bacterium]